MAFSCFCFVWESEVCHINAPLYTCLSPGPTNQDIAFRSTGCGISPICYLSESSYLQVRGAASCCDCCASGDGFWTNIGRRNRNRWVQQKAFLLSISLSVTAYNLAVHAFLHYLCEILSISEQYSHSQVSTTIYYVFSLSTIFPSLAFTTTANSLCVLHYTWPVKIEVYYCKYSSGYNFLVNFEKRPVAEIISDVIRKEKIPHVFGHNFGPLLNSRSFLTMGFF